MFQFRRFPTYAYLIQRRLTEYCSAGFPHSEICGSKLMCSSPQLIAACHVLLRLLMPRHSPCALSSLTYRRFHSDLSENSWFSLRIMQAYKDRNCMSPCILSDAVPQSICFVMCFHTTPLCCLTCFVTLFSFQGAEFQLLLKPDRNIQVPLNASIQSQLWWRLAGSNR